jgi:hypothetical protein
MYKNLKYAMKEKRITVEDIAKTLELTINGVRQKLWGNRRFTLEEGLAIHSKYFSDVSLDWLFEKVDKE